jgi:hypothetical protein
MGAAAIGGAATESASMGATAGNSSPYNCDSQGTA